MLKIWKFPVCLADTIFCSLNIRYWKIFSLTALPGFGHHLNALFRGHDYCQNNI